MKGEFLTCKEEVGGRLDNIFALHFPQLTRSHIKTLIEQGDILLEGKRVKSGEKIKEGKRISYNFEEAKPLDAKPQKVEFEIVYEDGDLLVINKPQGLVVHPCSSTKEGTLVNGLLYLIKDLSGINGVLRPGIVHRLDKNTSGLMLVAKNDFSHNSLAGQIKDKTCHREYWALCEGEFKNDSGRIQTFISRDKKDRKKMAVSSEGRIAITDYKVIKYFVGKTLVKFSLQTGRTHQIRVHASGVLKHPIVGDDVYGHGEKGLAGQLLHSKKITFIHPRSGEEMTFESELPPYFQNYIQKLKDR